MKLTEKEKAVISYLRNPLGMFREEGNPVKELLDNDVTALYNKMDDVIKDEGETRRALGDFDETYVLELASAKKVLGEEIKKRGL